MSGILRGGFTVSALLVVAWFVGQAMVDRHVDTHTHTTSSGSRSRLRSSWAAPSCSRFGAVAVADALVCILVGGMLAAILMPGIFIRRGGRRR